MFAFSIVFHLFSLPWVCTGRIGQLFHIILQHWSACAGDPGSLSVIRVGYRAVKSLDVLPMCQGFSAHHYKLTSRKGIPSFMEGLPEVNAWLYQSLCKSLTYKVPFCIHPLYFFLGTKMLPRRLTGPESAVSETITRHGVASQELHSQLPRKMWSSAGQGRSSSMEEPLLPLYPSGLQELGLSRDGGMEGAGENLIWCSGPPYPTRLLHYLIKIIFSKLQFIYLCCFVRQSEKPAGPFSWSKGFESEISLFVVLFAI